jgi:hypothetical protein
MPDTPKFDIRQWLVPPVVVPIFFALLIAAAVLSSGSSPRRLLLRLSDFEPRFVCQACGRKGAEVRPDFAPARMETIR